MIHHAVLLIVLAGIFGFFMTWSVGANDLANIMSTTMGSKAISVKQAIIIAIIFEAAGALLGGSGVARTIQNGIINAQIVNYPPEIFIYGMLAVLLASATWMTFASHFGMPVSITNATVGSLVGLGVLALGVHAVYWKQVGYIALSWVICPAFAAIIAYFLFIITQFLILSSTNPIKNAKRYIPFYLFLVGFVLSEITVIKLLIRLKIHLDLKQNLAIATITGIIVVIIGQFFIKRIKVHNRNERHMQFIYVEKTFAILMFFTACAMIYAHGSNDIAISVGPIAAIISLVKTGTTSSNGNMMLVILALGALGVIIGFLTFGKKIIVTVGSKITSLTPSRAFCATIAAATTVVISTSTGIPVSATQTLVGAILGVGLARGLGALDLRVIKNIFTSWFVTIPISAGLTAAYFNLMKDLLM